MSAVLNLNYLLLFLLPAYLIRIPLSNSLSLNLLEILLIFAIITNFYQALQVTSLKKLWSSFYSSKNTFLPITFILLGFITSYLLNQTITNWANWSDGLGKLLDLIILPIIYALSLSVLIKLKKISLFNLLNAYYLSTILISILGLIYFANNWLTFDNRLSIFFQSPNQLAIFIAPAILISVSNLLTPPTPLKSKKLISFLAIFLLIFILYQTFSLGAWLATIFSISYLFFRLKKITLATPLLKLLLFATIAGLICILNIDLLLTALNYQPQIPANSYDSRLAIHQVDQRIISTNWLQGVGINNFQNTYLSYQRYFPSYPQWAVPHAHNNLLHFWIEGGLLAGIGLFLLIYNILLPKKINHSISLQPLPLSIFLYFILHGLVDTTIWTPLAAILFFFVALQNINK